MTVPLITAHPVQLTFAAGCADVYKEENGAADGDPRLGVAYLIHQARAVTAASILADCELGQAVWLRFSGGLRAATLLARDDEVDCALLELQPAVVSQLVMKLRHGLCQPGDACQTWAATPTLRSPGQVVQALVHEPLGEDGLRSPTLLLRMVAGSERWHKNLAGSPILHDGYVIGHLRTIMQLGGETLLLACPAPYVGALEQTIAPRADLPPQPPKASYAPAWYIPRPMEESRVREWLKLPGRPLFIWAPEGHGKTWYLRRLQHEMREQGTSVICINLERMSQDSRTGLEAFVAEVEQLLLRQLMAERLLPVLPQSAPLHLEGMLDLALRACAPRPMYVALDQFDALRDTMFQEGFITLLAGFAARSAYDTAWRGLRLLLFSATAPDWLLRTLSTRPFASVAQELPDLSLLQMETLARLHQLTPTQSELLALQALIGGQPCLARVALYVAAVRGESLSQILHRRTAAPTVFDPFLEACQRRVAAQPGLWPTLLRILREQPLQALDRLLLPRLERMGIVWRADAGQAQPEYTLRYPLYRRLLEL